MREWRKLHPENTSYQQQYHKKYGANPVNALRARFRASLWYMRNIDRARARNNAKHHATKILKGRKKGDAHHSWKGDSIEYHGLHLWVVRERGKPSMCEHCGATDKSRYHWANVDHQYRRKLEDFIRLCVSCHKKYDYQNGLSDIGSRGGSIKNKKI